jgi:hypothetical protein
MNHRIKFLKMASLAVTAALMSSCVNVTKDATFVVSGQVVDGFGNAVVLDAGQNIQLCVNASYISDTGVAGSASHCADVVSDQFGRFLSPIAFKIHAANANKIIDIKNAKIYGKKYDRASKSYFKFPVTILKATLKPDGGVFLVNIAVFNID